MSKIWTSPLIVAAVVIGVFGIVLLQWTTTIWASSFLLVVAGALALAALRLRKKTPRPSANPAIPWVITAAAVIVILLASRQLNVALIDLGSEGGSDLQSRAEATVAAQLRDPSSAQFRAVEVIEQPDGRSVVCGEVNGKNAYGGYAGFTRFVVDGARVELEPSEVVLTNDGLAASTNFLRLHTEACVRAKLV
ncbi:hypothetical protein [Brevundimonas balnearis]|uniref:DUF4131 domain-containing protein n=1 Tax=Brevundimonas balnearis TaxID=1572858 RepID=A0ABV6R405_9CAUL